MESMASYIHSILKSQPVVLMSWGSFAFQALENGFSFVVNGFVYKGKVSILYNEGQDLFDIQLGENTYSGIFFDELVSFLDRKIEKNCGESQYEEKVTSWFESEEFKTMFEDEE
jgi:hypothetical protein